MSVNHAYQRRITSKWNICVVTVPDTRRLNHRDRDRDIVIMLRECKWDEEH